MAELIYYEDFRTGQIFELGTYKVTAEEIVEFAKQYDPQPMHTDAEAAKHTMVGGLIASGWHTCAIAMRLLCDGLFNKSTSIGGVSVDDARWHKPVRPNDTLKGRAEVIGLRPSSKGGRGFVNFKCEYFVGPDKVLSFTTWPIFSTRG